jgi:solute carrier family 45, member 1/2/4
MAVTMVGLMGFSWALTLWAPFALIARCVSFIQDVSRRESIASSRSQTPTVPGTLDQGSRLPAGDYGTRQGLSVPGVEDYFTRDRGSEDILSPPLSTGISISNPEDRKPSQSTPLLRPQPRLAHLPPQPSPPLSKSFPDEAREITSAGTIMGLHNVFISSPQFLSTLLASIIFHFLNAGGRDEVHGLATETAAGWFGGSNIAVVLSVGGCGGIVAAYLTWRLKEEEEEEEAEFGSGE